MTAHILTGEKSDEIRQCGPSRHLAQRGHCVVDGGAGDKQPDPFFVFPGAGPVELSEERLMSFFFSSKKRGKAALFVIQQDRSTD